MRERWKRF